jgi:thioredoxin 1
MALRTVSGAEFDSEVLQQEGWVVVDFYADWCGPCRWIAPLVERFAEQHAGRVTVVKVDSDADEAIAERYTVKKIPTLIAFKDGREVRRALFPQSMGQLEALIQEG